MWAALFPTYRTSTTMFCVILRWIPSDQFCTYGVRRLGEVVPNEIPPKVKKDCGNGGEKLAGKVCSAGSAELTLREPAAKPGWPGLRNSRCVPPGLAPTVSPKVSMPS